MLLNSPYFLCDSLKQKIIPNSRLYNLQTVPKNLHLTSNRSFLFCDTQGTKTVIKQFQLDSLSPTINSKQPFQQKLNFYDQAYTDTNNIITIDQVEGLFSSYAFNDESVLFLNRAGDFYYHNLLNKNVFLAEKQHPGLYSDPQILTLDGFFLTCGGCVKNPLSGLSQILIKVWKINEQQDTLQLKSRINTGHSRSVQNSFLMNQKVVTLSSDKTIRISNLSTESVERLIYVNQDLYSGCSIDYNTIIVGGMGKQLKVFDSRSGRAMIKPIAIQRQLTQITKIVRFTDNQLLFSNINQLFSLDLRTMRTKQQGKYEGERISEITVINKQSIVIGNKQKTFQIWKCI